MIKHGTEDRRTRYADKTVVEMQVYSYIIISAFS